jgi:hypothetical protein
VVDGSANAAWVRRRLIVVKPFDNDRMRHAVASAPGPSSRHRSLMR